MKNLKILIVENDIPIQESLEEIVNLLQHKVVGAAPSVGAAMNMLAKNPDLVLLDIHLNGNESGIDFANVLDKQGVPFIFITAFADADTVHQAVKTNPYGYIVKPFGLEDIYTAIQVAMKTYISLQKQADNEAIIINKDRSIFMKVDSSLVKIREDEILWAEARGDYVIFKTDTNTFIVHSTMKNVLEKLSSTFVKVHRSYIVNLDKIVDIDDSNLLIEDKVIPISRSSKSSLLQKINIL